MFPAIDFSIFYVLLKIIYGYIYFHQSETIMGTGGPIYEVDGVD